MKVAGAFGSMIFEETIPSSKRLARPTRMGLALLLLKPTNRAISRERDANRRERAVRSV